MSVVVTGLGAVGPWGAGTQPLGDALRDGRALHGAAPRAYPDWVPILKARRMGPPSLMAVVAAKMALRAAAIDGLDPDSAVCLATTFGPMSFTEEVLEQMRTDGPEAASPFLFAECVANAPAAQVAIATGARGPNVTITQREAGAALTVAQGAQLIRNGRAPVVLCGCVDEMTDLCTSVLRRFRAVADEARPFDRRRNGFVPGEGAAVVVLEAEDAAAARGAAVLARVVDSRRAFDPTAPAHGWGRSGDELADVVRPLTAGVDRVVSSASGAVAGDTLEARVLRGAFDTLPPVLAPKAVTGEYGGGHLAAAILAARGAPFGATPGFATRDPELDVRPHDGRDLPPPRRVLVSSLASGGAAAWLVLEAAR